MTANPQVDVLIHVTSKLITLLDREVELLRAMRVSDIVSLQKEKHDLTIQYEESIRLLAANPSILEG